MSHETGGAGDEPVDDDYVDIDEDLEPDSEEEGLGTRVRQKLGNAKDKYFDFHTVEQPKQDQGVAGTNISRRGFAAGAAQVAVGAYAVTEATDGDGWDVDWNSNGAGTGGAPAGGGVGPSDDTDGSQAGAGTSGQQYAWETEEELIDETGLNYPGEAGAYLGAVDASEVESTLDESGYTGDDPTGALNAEEVSMSLDDITPHQGLYAVDVDRKEGNDGDYDMFVQLVGEEDGGLYVTREGAQEIGDMQFEEVFEGYESNS